MNYKGLCITFCSNLHELLTFLLAICVLPQLSQLAKQACGPFVCLMLQDLCTSL